MSLQIFFHPERCLMCLSCILACQLNSLGGRDVRFLPPKKPLPKISLTFSGGTPWIWKCQQCTQAPCAEACISGSIRRLESGAGIEVRQEACVGCGSCLLACPFSIPARNPADDHFSRCNLCQGEEIPPCVKACQAKALVFEDASRFAQKRKKRFLLQSRGLP